MNTSGYYIKKMKVYEREALLPLYKKHVHEYLLRIVKANRSGVKTLLRKIETYQEVATCHEVAFNSIFNLSIETHQNDAGFEYTYTNHEKAKRVSRDQRVKLIWALIYEELIRNPLLRGYEPLELEDRYLSCPVCGESIFNLTTGEWDSDNNCDCYYISGSGVLIIQNNFRVELLFDRMIRNENFLKKYTIYVDELDLIFINREGEELIDRLLGRYENCYNCNSLYLKKEKCCNYCYLYCEKHDAIYLNHQECGYCESKEEEDWY